MRIHAGRDRRNEANAAPNRGHGGGFLTLIKSPVAQLRGVPDDHDLHHREKTGEMMQAGGGAIDRSTGFNGITLGTNSQSAKHNYNEIKWAKQ